MAGRLNPSTPVKTPIRSSAYAGSTFDASPAPAALPIPKLFSRSVPATPAPAGLEARLRAEDSTAEPIRSTDEHDDAEDPAFTYEPSPLDIFFRADREEKARAQRAMRANQRYSLGSTLATTSAPLTPPAYGGGLVTPNGTDPFSADGDRMTARSDRVPARLPGARPSDVVRAHTAPSAPNGPHHHDEEEVVEEEKEEEEEEERRRAQSRALKALIMTPPRKQPVLSPTSHPEADEGLHHIVRASMMTPRQPPAHSSISPATYPATTASTMHPLRPDMASPSRERPPHRRQPSSSAHANSSRPRWRPSYLRQEIKRTSHPSGHDSQAAAYPPSTLPRPPDPDPAARPPDLGRAVTERGSIGTRPNPPVRTTTTTDDDVRTIEADLRRILNIRDGASNAGEAAMKASSVHEPSSSFQGAI